MMVKLLISHTGMCIKGPESWWIAKSITISRVVNQSKIQSKSTMTEGSCGLILDLFTTSWGVIDFAVHQFLGPLIHIPVWYINNFTIIYFTKNTNFGHSSSVDRLSKNFDHKAELKLIFLSLMHWFQKCNFSKKNLYNVTYLC